MQNFKTFKCVVRIGNAFKITNQMDKVISWVDDYITNVGALTPQEAADVVEFQKGYDLYLTMVEEKA